MKTITIEVCAYRQHPVTSRIDIQGLEVVYDGPYGDEWAERKMCVREGYKVANDLGGGFKLLAVLREPSAWAG